MAQQRMLAVPAVNLAPALPANLVLPPSIFAIPSAPEYRQPVALAQPVYAPAPVLVKPAVTETQAAGNAVSMAAAQGAKFDGSRRTYLKNPPLARLANVGLTDVSSGAILQELNTYRPGRAKPAKRKASRRKSSGDR